MLVFLGLAVTILQRFPRDAPRRVVQLYRRAAAAAFGAFVLGVVVIGLALLWFRGQNATVYSLISWIFAGELLLVGISAGIVTWKALRP